MYAVNGVLMQRAYFAAVRSPTACMGDRACATIGAMKLLHTLHRWAAVLLLCLGAAGASAQAIKVVYHVNTGVDTIAPILTNVRNHLNADPTAQIVVVTHGPGVDFLLDGARDGKGREFSSAIGELAGRGVQFRVCQNTLNSRGIDPAKVVLEASLVPSGVAEVARLQARESYVYLKP